MMRRVTLMTRQQTAEEYAEALRYFYRYWDDQEERGIAAAGYCPFFEVFPSEWVGEGGHVGRLEGGGYCCLDYYQDTQNCKGQYCHCPLSIQQWQNAWTDDIIGEEEEETR